MTTHSAVGAIGAVPSITRIGGVRRDDGNLARPVLFDRRRTDDQPGSAWREVPQRDDRLARLAEAHVVGEDGAPPAEQERDAVDLVGEEPVGERDRAPEGRHRARRTAGAAVRTASACESSVSAMTRGARTAAQPRGSASLSEFRAGEEPARRYNAAFVSGGPWTHQLTDRLYSYRSRERPPSSIAQPRVAAGPAESRGRSPPDSRLALRLHIFHGGVLSPAPHARGADDPLRRVR